MRATKDLGPRLLNSAGQVGRLGLGVRLARTVLGVGGGGEWCKMSTSVFL